MKHSMKNAILFAVLIGFSAYTVVLAAIDCSKIRAYDCSVVQGGDVISGESGAVTGGATITVTFNGRTRTATANEDGSFFFGIAGLGAKRGDTVTITVGEESCTVTLERCP